LPSPTGESSVAGLIVTVSSFPSLTLTFVGLGAPSVFFSSDSTEPAAGLLSFVGP
jgi:hypothetical protein